MVNYLETIKTAYKVIEELRETKRAVENIPMRDDDEDFNTLRKLAIEVLNALIKQGEETMNN